MNSRNGQSDSGAQSVAIRALNDAFRRTFKGGTVVLSAGIMALAATRQHAILAAVPAFDDFKAVDDPPWRSQATLGRASTTWPH